MRRIASQVRTSTAEFQENRARMLELSAELRAHLEAARLGGPEPVRRLHVERGKLLPRERVERLLDPGSPFLELSPLAGHGLYDGQAPGAGMLTGIGTIHGRHCVVVANDATVKGGTYFPMTVKKHVRAQEVAPGGVAAPDPRGANAAHGLRMVEQLVAAGASICAQLRDHAP